MQRLRTRERLRAKDLDTLPAGEHQDGGGLLLRVEPTGAKRWVQRLTINGQRVNRGLGPYPQITLDMAREQSIDLWRAAKAGRDVRASSVTFRQVFEEHWAQRKKGLKNKHHKWQWEQGMKAHAFPVIGDRPVAVVTHDEIVAILVPIWRETPETARRVLQRLSIIFDIAISRGLREKANPCTGVAADLGKQGDRVSHHAALPYVELPAFLKLLRGSTATPVTKLAFEWLVLTATRSGETRLATWAEIQGNRWVIPAGRMKGAAEHVVPLAPRCLEILRWLKAFDGYQIGTGLNLTPVDDSDSLTGPTGLIFPSTTGRQLSDMAFIEVLRRLGLGKRATAHGFRTSFRTWATEVDKCREVVAEATLAHAVRGKVEAAYRRTTYLEERVGLMERWAEYCCGAAATPSPPIRGGGTLPPASVLG